MYVASANSRFSRELIKMDPFDLRCAISPSISVGTQICLMHAYNRAPPDPTPPPPTIPPYPPYPWHDTGAGKTPYPPTLNSMMLPYPTRQLSPTQDDASTGSVFGRLGSLSLRFHWPWMRYSISDSSCTGLFSRSSSPMHSRGRRTSGHRWCPDCCTSGRRKGHCARRRRCAPSAADTDGRAMVGTRARPSRLRQVEPGREGSVACVGGHSCTCGGRT